jgi:hypothetical protein
MDQLNDHQGYELLLKVFGNTPYVQHRSWSTQREFKLDFILTDPPYINSKLQENNKDQL